VPTSKSSHFLHLLRKKGKWGARTPHPYQPWRDGGSHDRGADPPETGQRRMNPPETIQTERLLLRKPRLDDAPVIFESYAQDPEVTRYMTWRPHKSVEETYRIVELMLQLWDEGEAYSYAITLRNSDEVIGMIAMHPDDFKVGIGYVLARPHWGKGYMTEAACAITNWLLEQPDVYRVYATCDVEHLASARVMEKAGMIREGLLRRYVLHPNLSDEPRNAYLYAVVR